MDNAGDYSLFANAVTTAIATPQEQTAITALDGMASVTLEATFAGTGGTSVTALIRSRNGSGGTWREIARFDFTAADAKSCTIVASAASIASFAALAANSVLQGFLGTDLQAVISSVGTWTNGTLAVRASVR